MQWSRRHVLSSVTGIGAAGIAGCLSDANDGTTPDATTTPSEQRTDTPVADPTYDLSVDHDVASWNGYDPDWEHPTDPPTVDVEVETIIEGLAIPWDLAFAPDGDLYLSERTGRIARYDSTDLKSVTSADVIDHAEAIDPGADADWWDAGGEGGLLGLTVHPNYPDVPLVYAFYTRESNGEYVNRLSYFDVSADGPGASETVVIDDIPGDQRIHNGARVTFGPARYLWVTTGDANDEAIARDPASLGGAVLRLEPDGSAPDENPAIDGWDPRVYSTGHRNPQGISFLPDGTPIVSEHGPGARDEVIVLEPGDDHGWGPDDERGRDGETYPGTDYDRPVVNTGPSETWAPSGCVFYTGDAVESWSNRLLVGGLRSQRLNIVTVYPADGEPSSSDGGTRYDADWMNDEYDAVAHAALDDEIGRIRHVEQGPNGELYAITSNRDGRADAGFPVDDDDRLVRITPV